MSRFTERMAVFRIRGMRMTAIWVCALGTSVLCTLLGSGVVLAAQPAAPSLQTQTRPQVMQAQGMQTIGRAATPAEIARSEEHTSELQSH